MCISHVRHTQRKLISRNLRKKIAVRKYLFTCALTVDPASFSRRQDDVYLGTKVRESCLNF